MDNLISNTYLHNTKWNFLNNLAQAGIGVNGSNFRTTQEISRAKERVLALYNTALSREQQFYSNFKVANHIEWSKKYLIMDSDDNNDNTQSIRQIIYKIINSTTMRDILNGKKTKSSAVTNKLETARQQASEEIIVDFCNTILEEIRSGKQIEDSIGKYIVGIGPKSKGGGGRAQQDLIMKAFGLEVTKALKKNSNQPIRSSNSKAIQELIKTMQQERINDVNLIILEAINYLETQLRQLQVDVNQIPIISSEWRRVLEQNLNSRKRTLISNSSQVTAGGLGEEGDKLSFELMVNLGEDETLQGLSVQSYGQELVDRYGKLLTGSNNAVESKIDLKYNFSDEERGIYASYNIQHKNYMADYYNNIGVLKVLDEFEKITGSIKLHGTLGYSSYLNMINATAGAVNDKSSMDLLSYLLVNYSVFNQGLGGEKAYKSKGTNGGVPLTKIQGIIDSIFSENIDIFISDILELDENTYQTGEKIDFIIFQGRLLLPISSIYSALIDTLEYAQKEMYRPIHVTFTLPGFASQYENMRINKARAAAEAEGVPFVMKDYYKFYDSNKDHTDTGFIEAGAAAGQQALNLLTISGIHYNFKFAQHAKQNLVSVTSGI